MRKDEISLNNARTNFVCLMSCVYITHGNYFKDVFSRFLAKKSISGICSVMFEWI